MYIQVYSKPVLNLFKPVYNTANLLFRSKKKIELEARKLDQKMFKTESDNPIFFLCLSSSFTKPV
jgi:hypothetical protein